MMKMIIKITKTKRSSKSDDCTQCGDYRHKRGFRCPSQSIQVQNLFKKLDISQKCVSSKMRKQQHIQTVLEHIQRNTLQPEMSDESFHDAIEENIPSDDDFVHNYMICVQESSIQQKQQYAVMNAIAKFKWLQQIVEVKF